MKGLLECGRAMRMDGTFVGQLVSTGSITVGPTGKVTGHLKGLKFLRVEGLVREGTGSSGVLIAHVKHLDYGLHVFKNGIPVRALHFSTLLEDNLVHLLMSRNLPHPKSP